MQLASMFRAIGLQICRLPSTSLSGGAFGSLVDRPRPGPRRKPVRGAASEPHYTDASFNGTGDGRIEAFTV
jgi:hypothetical protein